MSPLLIWLGCVPTQITSWDSHNSHVSWDEPSGKWSNCGFPELFLWWWMTLTRSDGFKQGSFPAQVLLSFCLPPCETCFSFFFFLIYYYYTLSSRVHVHNVQVRYICILVPCWCAAPISSSAPINSSFTSGITPNAIPPHAPMIGPSVWCSPSCVQVFSLFNSHLWLRTCSVLFSVLVIVYSEWWFPASSMSLQRTWTHPFLWLHSIPWCICATFSLSSLRLMGIGLVPNLYYCELCCNKHTCACVFIVQWFIILWMYIQ